MNKKLIMISNLKIRKANHDDWETIANFQVMMAKETEAIDLDWTTVSMGVKAIFENPGLGQYFLAEDEGKVIAGLMTTFEWSDWRNAMVWWLQSVFVLPAYRKMGVFGKMYAHVKHLVRQNKNVSGIRLYMVTSNETARKAYEAVGMDGERYQLFEWMKDY
jgi:GNAT superfamily N-acetyltransferase